MVMVAVSFPVPMVRAIFGEKISRRVSNGEIAGERGHVIEFETTVVSNFLGRGDPCTQY
jgi:hypothetical protein